MGASIWEPNGGEVPVPSLTASAVIVTPTGGIASVNVQAALAELDAEKLSASDPSISTLVLVEINKHKNLIVGGDFAAGLWQQGTIFTGPSTGAELANTWRINYNSSAVVDILKTADGPTASEASVYSPNCLHVDVTTADVSIAAADYLTVDAKIAGNNIRHVGFGQAGTRFVTLTFWVKSTKTGTFCVSFRNSATDRSYVAEYTVGVTNTWEKKTITLSADISGTWLYDTGTGLEVGFTLAGGAAYQTTAGTWQAGNFIATSNQVNALDSAANNFKLALVQLEYGSAATAFESPHTSIDYQTTALAALTEPTGSRNKLINGGMRVSQRGSTFPDVAGYCLDRWYVNRTGGVAGLIAAQAAGFFSDPRYGMSLQKSGTSTAALNIYQAVGMADSRALAGKTVTLSFEIGTGVNAVTSPHYAAIYYQTGATEGGPQFGVWTLLGSQSFTLTTNTAYVKKSFSFNVPSNATQIEINIVLSAAATSTADERYYVTGIQLEQGSVATPFEHLPFGAELALCEGFFETSYNDGSAIGSVSLPGRVHVTNLGSIAQDTPHTIQFKVRKRGTPTVTTYSAASGSSGYCAVDNMGQSGGTIFKNVAANTAWDAHWTADAEMY